MVRNQERWVHWIGIRNIYQVSLFIWSRILDQETFNLRSEKEQVTTSDGKALASASFHDIDIESKEWCDGIAARQRIQTSIERAGQKPSSSHTCSSGTDSAVSLGKMNRWVRQQGKDRCFISFLHLRLLLLACLMDLLQCYLLSQQGSGPGLFRT